VTFRLLTAILAGLFGGAAVVSAAAADITGRPRLFVVAGASAVLLVIAAAVRFVVLG